MGPFTVFAPTNEAFAKLPKATLASLLKPENKAKLVDILTYHVVAGDVNKSDLMDMDMLQTVEGKKVTARRGRRCAHQQRQGDVRRQRRQQRRRAHHRRGAHAPGGARGD